MAAGAAPRTLASELRFPEGPVALPDGSVLVVEVLGGALTRIAGDGRMTIVADVGGGPNGAAIGPDGRCYVCNNGGVNLAAAQAHLDGSAHAGTPDLQLGNGSVQAVDLRTGQVQTLYTHCGDDRLLAPNDLVFDDTGGFYFTDHGVQRGRARLAGAVYYARPDGRAIRAVLPAIVQPNGVALSPAQDILYVAQTDCARLWAFDILEPGVVRHAGGPTLGGRLVHGRGGLAWFDSLAVEADGRICVACPYTSSVLSITPDGAEIDVHAVDDPMPTNLCFGGADLKTAYVTLSATGRLAALPWTRPGLPLAFADRAPLLRAA